ncbi:MAG TPA: serine hydrolase [Steroidobacteraceae bacterium]|nr:serine hydrolase [Steroidobacteraceae bacterium]
MRVWMITGFLFIASAAIAQTTPVPEPVAADAPWEIPPDEKIRQMLAERVQVKGAGAVIGVIEPAGRRVITHGNEVDGNTIFQIGSVTKTFTALLLADMVVRGEVALDDPASKYLWRGARMPERGRPITLQDLATHVSGLPSMPTNFPLRADPDPIAAYTPKLLNQFLATHELDRAPGEKWAYSNLGVSLLGRLLAQLAGTNYEALLKQRVLDPLGLRDTSISLSKDQARRLATGLDRYGNPAAIWEMRTLQASGSLRSSANDLLEFLSVYLGKRETALSRAIELQLSVRAPVRNAQALGWGTGTVEGREIFAHEGGKPGYRAFVAFDRVKQRGVVVLVNANIELRPSLIGAWIMTGQKLPLARDAPAPRIAATVDRKTLDSCEGRYQLDSGRVLTVVRKDDHLVTDTTGGGPQLFLPAGARDFFEPSAGEELSFTADENERVTSVIVFPRGRDAGGLVTGKRLP